MRYNRLHSLPTQSLQSLPSLSVVWFEGNPLPGDTAINVGRLKLNKGEETHNPAAVRKYLADFDLQVSFFSFSFLKKKKIVSSLLFFYVQNTNFVPSSQLNQQKLLNLQLRQIL